MAFGKQKIRSLMLGKPKSGITSLRACLHSYPFSDAPENIRKEESSTRYINGEEIELLLHDASKECFREPGDKWLRGIDFVVAVDLTAKDEDAQTSFNDCLHLTQRCETDRCKPVLVIGTKSDLSTEADAALLTKPQTICPKETEGRLFQCHVTSAKTGTGVESAFDNMARQVLGVDNSCTATRQASSNEPPASDKGCCIS